MAKLFFVGTGSGKTSLTRFHSSILLSTNDTNILIDAGDGISRALLAQDIKYNSIDNIFITHLHSDHYTGVPSLITQMKMQKREKDLCIYAEPGIIKVLEEFILNSYLFTERLGFKIIFKPVLHNKQIDIQDNFKLLSRQNTHLDSVVGYKFNPSQSFSSSSLLITVANKIIHYTSDIGGVEDLKLFNDHDVDVLICETSHIEPNDVIEYVTNNSNPEQIIFTHINEEDSETQKKFFAAVSSEIGQKCTFASDGLKIEL